MLSQISSSLSLQFSPAQAVTRQPANWIGIGAEIIRFTESPYEFSFRGPVHTLIATEPGERTEGESRIEGAQTSRRRDIGEKLLLIPSGYKYGGWSRHAGSFQITAVFLDPKAPFLAPELRFEEIELVPYIHFEHPGLRATALKLKTLVENPGTHSRLYAETLGSTLAIELIRWRRETLPPQIHTRGGLAGWQRRVVCDFIESHLDQDISLATLASLAKISPYHLCRAFKQSVGMPPHRYLTHRRIERAKALLANPGISITDVALAVGFSESSHLATAFRKVTGTTPSTFRRSID